MIDMLWRIFMPVIIFLGINLTIQSTFSWYFVGKNLVDSNGQITSGTQIFDDNTIVIMMITMLITIPIMIVMMKRDEDNHGFRTFAQHYRLIDFRHFYLLVPLGITMCLGFTKLVTIFPIDNIIGSYEKVLDSYNDSNIVLRAIVLCVLVPVAEELVYRGMFYKRLKSYYELTIAAYLSALFFGIVHMNLVQGIYACLCAFILIFVYEKYKTIMAPIFLHMVINTMALISSEFTVFDKINNTFIAKLFFMLLELVAVVALVKLIWHKKSNKTD